MTNPFTKKQIDEMRGQIKDIDGALGDCENAKRAGLDCSDLETQLKDNKKQLQQLIEVYGTTAK